MDLSIGDGDMVAVVGPNGSGKSTLVRTLAGLIRPVSGRALVDGRDVYRMRPRSRAARLGLLSQAADVPGLTTVAEHVGLGRHHKRWLLGRWAEEDAAATCRAMDVCEIQHLAERKMDNLSGGERQRVRLATLLAQDPRALLLDEPLTGLDIEHQLDLLHLLRRLNNEHHRTVVCVLHDLDLALRFFARVVVIADGTVAADGPPGRVLCPRVFEDVFKVDGRVGCEAGGEPVVICRRSTGSRRAEGVELVVRPASPDSGLLTSRTAHRTHQKSS
ncbi:MAG: ABC transporter ATP-binding protein [Planctomycetota bacterium]